MDTIAIVVAESRGGLVAIAETSNLSIIEGTERPFDGLETFSYPTLSSVGVIQTGKNGWIALATMD